MCVCVRIGEAPIVVQIKLIFITVRIDVSGNKVDYLIMHSTSIPSHYAILTCYQQGWTYNFARPLLANDPERKWKPWCVSDEMMIMIMMLQPSQFNSCPERQRNSLFRQHFSDFYCIWIVFASSTLQTHKLEGSILFGWGFSYTIYIYILIILKCKPSNHILPLTRKVFRIIIIYTLIIDIWNLSSLSPVLQ